MPCDVRGAYGGQGALRLAGLARARHLLRSGWQGLGLILTAQGVPVPVSGTV
jgi:hypothetical protein